MVDRARLRALQAQLAELNRIKQKVQNEISRTIGHIENLALRDIPTKIITKVNKQVNAEGYMERIIKNRFKAEARYGPGSTKWRQLTPEYAARKAAAGYGNRILFRTGALYFATLQAVAGTFRYGQVPDWDIGAVATEYAEYVQQVRPFILPPSKKELEPSMNRARALIRLELRKLARGQK